MTTRQHDQLRENGRCYFMTSTVVAWKHVFIWHSLISIIFNSIQFFQEKRKVKTVGYCLMPNHFHWIFILPDDFDDVSFVIRTFKSYTATTIIKNLKRMCSLGMEPVPELFRRNPVVRIEDPCSLLDFFSDKMESMARQFHRFWLENSDIKAVCSESFLKEKLNYIHNNPLRPHWAFVDEASDYPYGSCRFYRNNLDWNGINIMQLM
jgi:putative transposase